MITVITPVYKEPIELIAFTIRHLLRYQSISKIVIAATKQDPGHHEIEVLLHDNFDFERVRLVVCQSAGRALQMNQGAELANSDILLFVHCDTQLPNNADRLIMESLIGSNWGRFDVRLDDQRLVFKVIAWFINKRSRLTAISTGDQGIFVKHDFFQKVGGFPDQALMEDVEFSKSAKKFSLPAFIDKQVVTSARRWQQDGVIKTVLLMWWLRALYWLGVPSNRLTRIYRNIR